MCVDGPGFAAILRLMEINSFRRFQDTEAFTDFLLKYQQSGGAMLSAADRLRLRVDGALAQTP